MSRSSLSILLISLLLLISCKTDKKDSQSWRTKKSASENQIHNQLLEVEKEQGWALIFDTSVHFNHKLFFNR